MYARARRLLLMVVSPDIGQPQFVLLKIALQHYNSPDISYMSDISYTLPMSARA